MTGGILDGDFSATYSIKKIDGVQFVQSELRFKNAHVENVTREYHNLTDEGLRKIGNTDCKKLVKRGQDNVDYYEGVLTMMEEMVNS